MRVAVISDVHGNWHALEAVLAAIDEERPDELWCLGDVVGYGPRPNECCAAVRARADLCLVGNHDLAALGRIDVDEFSHDAALSARWTRERLSADSRAFLERLEPRGERPGAQLFHGSPDDPVWTYVLSPEAMADAFALSSAPVVLVGHSHVALAVVERGGSLRGGLAPAGTELERAADERWLLNPGSVGQPRDGDPRAAWLLLDLSRRFAGFRRVQYSVEHTQRELREQGLPEALAARLAEGQ
jgi:diadenosine tetraphosphatase ApaH/serine/threonine PP2A family protein phosphatase